MAIPNFRRKKKNRKQSGVTRRGLDQIVRPSGEEKGREQREEIRPKEERNWQRSQNSVRGV